MKLKKNVIQGDALSHHSNISRLLPFFPVFAVRLLSLDFKLL